MCCSIFFFSLVDRALLVDSGMGDDLLTFNADLYEACATDNADAVRAILDASLAGLNGPNADDSGRTPLHICAVNDSKKAAAVLLDYLKPWNQPPSETEVGGGDRLDINARNAFGYMPLHNALYYGHHEVAMMLVSAGAITDDRENYGKMAPLEVGRTQGKDGAVKKTKALMESARNRLFLAARRGDGADLLTCLDSADTRSELEDLELSLWLPFVAPPLSPSAAPD